MTTRRRVLTILAGAAALPVFGARASTSVEQWSGIALGADARIILDHPRAGILISQALEEIRRLEKIFSLYLPDSQLLRLNREGILFAPAFELVELLSICSNLNSRTDGAFDPTIQALWSLYAQQFSKGQPPSSEQIARAMAVTGWKHVEFSSESVSFGRSGVLLTLNGVAQGFIADRVTDFFSKNGVSNVLVNTGEIAALGMGPDGSPWRVKLGNSKGTSVPLTNAAIATSAPLGTAFDTEGKAGHIMDPRTGYPGGNWSEVTVISRSAAEADGLSTAFCLMSQPEIAAAKGNSRVLLR